MSISGRLVQGFRARVGRSLDPAFISNAKAYELYQGYVFCIILSAAWNEGASVVTKDAFGTTNPPKLLFRRSPGEIYGTTGPYAHAVLEFPGKPLLEVHVSIMVRGISQVAHAFLHWISFRAASPRRLLFYCQWFLSVCG